MPVGRWGLDLFGQIEFRLGFLFSGWFFQWLEVLARRRSTIFVNKAGGPAGAVLRRRSSFPSLPLSCRGGEGSPPLLSPHPASAAARLSPRSRLALAPNAGGSRRERAIPPGAPAVACRSRPARVPPASRPAPGDIAPPIARNGTSLRPIAPRRLAVTPSRPPLARSRPPLARISPASRPPLARSRPHLARQSPLSRPPLATLSPPALSPRPANAAASLSPPSRPRYRPQRAGGSRAIAGATAGARATAPPSRLAPLPPASRPDAAATARPHACVGTSLT
nr:lysine-rich arabinogalactan protein 19-like [Lolium perenne]